MRLRLSGVLKAFGHIWGPNFDGLYLSRHRQEVNFIFDVQWLIWKPCSRRLRCRAWMLQIIKIRILWISFEINSLNHPGAAFGTQVSKLGMCHMIQRLIDTIYFFCAGPNLYTPVPSLNATIGAVSAQPWVKLVHQLRFNDCGPFAASGAAAGSH